MFLGLIISLGLLLRVYGVGEESVWNDEVVSVQHLNTPTLLSFLGAVRTIDAPMMPLYFILEYAWWHLTGHSIVALRMLSVILGTLTIPAVFLLARRLFSTEAGLVAALLMALSLPVIYFSQEIRVYALLLLLVPLSVQAMFAALEEHSTKGLIINGLLNAAIIGTHLFSFLVIGVEGLFLLGVAFRERRFRRRVAYWVIGHFLLAICVAIWVSTIDFDRLADGSGWMKTPHMNALLHSLVFLAGCRIQSSDWSGLFLKYHPPLDVVMAAFVLMLVARLLWAVFRHKETFPRKDIQRSVLFLLAWFIIPPIVLFALSRGWRNCFVERYTLYVSPALYVLAGAGVCVFSKKSIRFLTISVLLAVSLSLFLMTPKPWRHNWAEVERLIIEHDSADCPIFVYRPAVTRELSYNCPQFLARTTRVYDLHLARKGTAWFILLPRHAMEFDRLCNKCDVDVLRFLTSGYKPLVLYKVSSVPSGVTAPSTAATPGN